jgi:hypothetical protein
LDIHIRSWFPLLDVYQGHLPTSKGFILTTLHFLITLHHHHQTTITMFTQTFFFLTLLPSLITAAKSRTVNPSLNAALRSAATNFDRNVLLSQETDWYYDFDAHPNYDSPDGAVINADAATFPALTGLGSSIALLKLAPCGMLPPHLHPRATNLVTAITGNTTSWMIGENGVQTRKVDLIPMRVTVFPQGSLHVMQNNGTSSSSITYPIHLITTTTTLSYT